MKIIKLYKDNVDRDQITEIADYFLRGLVVAYPTDTVYGLSCLAEDKKAVERVSRIKQRSGVKNYIVLMKSFCMVHEYCFVSKRQDEYLRAVWAPKSADLAHLENLPNKDAVTVILKSRGLLKHLENDEGGIAVRIPKDRFLLDLLKKVNKPIISTSLNISGQPNLSRVDNLEEVFKDNLPDAVVDGGVMRNKRPSRLIDITDIDKVKVIRGL